MTFIEQIRNDNKDVIQKLRDHPFIRQVIQGALPQENFDFFISQEVPLLYDYIRAAGICTSKAKDNDIFFFVTIQDFIYRELEITYSYFSNSDNFYFTTAVAPSSLGLSSFMLRTAYQNPLEVGFSTLYSLLALHFFVTEQCLDISPSHPYHHWLSVGSNPQFLILIQEYRRFMNRYALENPALTTVMGQTVRTGTFYLLHFFDDCLHQRDFYTL